MFFGHALVFNFHLNFRIFWYATCSFFFKFFYFFGFRQPQESHSLLWGFIIGYCIASRCNGMFLKTLLLAIFKKNCNFFKLFEPFIIFYFIRHQCPRDPLQGFKISSRIVSIVNGMVIYTDDSRFSNFLIRLAFFKVFFQNFCRFLGLGSLNSRGTSSGA